VTVPLVDMAAARRAVADLLRAIGEDPTREGLRETPQRVAQFWREFIAYDPGDMSTAFQQIETDQLVVVSGIPTWSICEHHLLPMALEVGVGYVTDHKVLGLSKLVRIVLNNCHALQIQERIAHGILRDIKAYTGTEHAGVIVRGLHLCMIMRGVKTPGVMTTSALSGNLYKNGPARAEFLSLVQKGGSGVWDGKV